jgi:hypothetical protein
VRWSAWWVGGAFGRWVEIVGHLVS